MSTAQAVSRLVAGVLAGERLALARAITLIESTREAHRAQALELLARLTPGPGDALRLGISGAPGVGKSTFIEALGNHAIERGRRVAVLSVDPSSAISGGSILGDKTRMAALARREEAFIRPSPAGATLGGVHRRTRESILLLEAAGFGLVIVETVGVGQSETAVARMTDVFLLLLPPAGGDELQGIKRGIVELADIILVNKADGDLLDSARQAVAEYRNAVRYLRARTPSWQVPVEAVSALEGSGVAQAWERIESLDQRLRSDGVLQARRAEQARTWLWDELAEGLLDELRRHPGVARLLPELERAVARGELPPTLASRKLLRAFTGS